MTLHHDIVRAEGATVAETIGCLHGILGSGANLRSLARRIVAADSRWQVALVDLRGHGRSSLPPPPHTVAACAADVAELVVRLDVPVRAVLGHSFGGKVALELAARGMLDGLRDVVVVDSLPGARPDRRGSETVLAVLDALERMPSVLESREQFLALARATGLAEQVAAWLAMSLRKTASGWSLTFDLGAVRAMLDDYFALDLWPFLEDRPPGAEPRVHVVVGARSPVFSSDDRSRLERLAREGRASADVLDAGHWVHVDDLEGLARVVERRVLSGAMR